MIEERLNLLRTKMLENGLDAYFINTNDYHLSEYIPEYFKVLRFFSGFGGSLAQLIVTNDSAYLFVDGRYHHQADLEAGIHGIQIMKLGCQGVLNATDFLVKYFKQGTVGLDDRCVSAAFVKELLKRKLTLKYLDIYSSLFCPRPALNHEQIYPLALEYCGYTRKAKLKAILQCLKGKTHVIADLTAIAYLLNLRSNDIAYTPVFLAYLLFYHDEVYLFVDLTRFKEELLCNLYDDGLIIKDYAQFYPFLQKVKDTVVLLAEEKNNYATYQSLAVNNKIVPFDSIAGALKAVKNPVEIKMSRLAHLYDGVAMVRFLKKLAESDKKGLTEYSVKKLVDESRLSYRAFDLSFNTIVAYNANAAMMHYSPTADNCAKLSDSGILLIDSGGQYQEGTTDITRTIALGEVSAEIKKYYTLVLKSLFNFAQVKFLAGMSGDQLDILARKDLWQEGIDYRCGTGHGVGQVSAVHEFPPRISYADKTMIHGRRIPLKPGNIFSCEPGVYFEGKYGIRLENLLLCQKDVKNEYGQFLSFTPLTMVPFDLNLIDKHYLDPITIKLINAYHKEVYRNLAPYLTQEELVFLKQATRRI